MRLRLIVIIMGLLVTGSGPVTALGDTIVLKDGTKIEGSIVSQDHDVVLVKIRKHSISFTKRIPIATVAKIEKGAVKPEATKADGAKPKSKKEAAPAFPGKRKAPSSAATSPDAPAEKDRPAEPEDADVDSRPAVEVDLRFGLKNSLFPETIEDEGQTIKPLRRKRFVLVPAQYDPDNVGLTISTRTYNFYLNEKKKATRKGILLMEDKSRDGAEPDLALVTKDPIWERVDLESPEEEKPSRRRAARGVPAAPKSKEATANELVCTNPRTPSRGKQGRPQDPSKRIRKARRPASGYLAFWIEVPEDQQTLEFQFKGGPRVLLLLDWMEQANKSLSDLKEDNAESALDGLAALVNEGSVPMAELGIAKLSEWRKSPSPDLGQASMARMDALLLGGLARKEAALRRAAWKSLITGQAEFSKTAASISKASPEVLEGLLSEAEKTLRESRAGGSRDSQAVEGGRAMDRSLVVPSKLPESFADANVFHALLTICQTGETAVVERVVDILLKDGTKQSVSLFASPSKAQALVAGRFKDVADEELKSAVFATLLKNARSSDLPKLAGAAASISMSIGSTDHPILALGSRAEGTAAQVALLKMLSRAQIVQSVLESREMVTLLRGLTAEEADPRVQEKTFELVLSKWRPTVRVTAAAGPPRLNRENPLAKFLADQLAQENEEVPVALSRALVSAGQVEATARGLKRANVETKRRVLERIARDAAFAKDDPTLRFFAAMSQDKAVATEALAQLNSAMTSLGPRRWFAHQAVKQQLKWQQINELAGSSEAGEAGMKVLRNVAATDRERREELELKGDRESRRRFVQEIDEGHKTNPDGAFGCVVYADLMFPVEGDKGTESQEPDDSAGGGKPLWRWVRNQWFAVDGISINKTKETGIVVRYGPGKEKKVITPVFEDQKNAPKPNVIRVNVTPLLRAAMESEHVRDRSWAEQVKSMDIPTDVIADFEYHQLGTWVAEIAFNPGGQRGQQSGTRVSLGQSEGKRKPYLANVRMVLEPKPKI